MPIPSDQLYTKFVVVDPKARISSVLQALPADRNERVWTYVLQPQADGRYLAVLWKDVEQLARDEGVVSDSSLFSSLYGLPDPIAAVEQSSMSKQSAQDLRDAQPGKCLVVLSEGQVIGLMYTFMRDAEPLGDDPFAGLLPSDFSGPIVLGEEGLPAEMPPAIGKDVEVPPTSALLGEETTAAEEAPPAPDNRVINAWLEDVDGKDMPAEQPLQVGNAYDLKFNVDAPKESARLTAAIDVNKLFLSLPPEQQTVDLLVMIETDDFTINGDDQQLLKVPRTGRSRNTATFNIEPKRNGPGVVKAFFYANNRVFQKMTITIQVGPAAASGPAMEASIQGLTMASAMNAPARQDTPVNLMIIQKEAGYQFILQGVGAMRAFLNLSETQIAELVAQTREVFKGIVYTLVGSQYVYQLDDTNISADVHAATLKTMAKHGTLMYRKLFYGPGSGPDARAMGDLLRKLSEEHQLHVEIVAERFTFPWSMLYSRADLKPDLSNVDPEGFWGFKHVIEYTPEFASATPVSFVPEITVPGKLGVSFVCNNGIDTQMKRPIIQGQRDYFQTLSDISMTEYPTTTDLYALLNNPDQPSQVLYFYCHAVSNLPGDKGGVGGSKVILSDGPATLDDLNFAAGTDQPPLKSAPLVFMNCCQSAELSPYLYDGLVPYLITKGARGVIGTEVDTPALFAAEFAKEFLTRFFKGNQKLGELLLDMRREYLLKKNNVMGLVYALHSSGEIFINRAAS
jgi:hypothetical protein